MELMQPAVIRRRRGRRRLTRRERLRRLAKALASPRTALWAAPALLLPFLTLFLLSQEPLPSRIEQTIEALPVPGGENATADKPGRPASPLGTEGTSSSSASVTLPLYSNSALVASSQMELMNAWRSGTAEDPENQLEAVDYARLHPLRRMQDDLLAGPVQALLTNPVSPDLSVRIFQEYCSARPDDPWYRVDVLDLPIDHNLLAAMLQLSRLTGSSIGICPRQDGFD